MSALAAVIAALVKTHLPRLHRASADDRSAGGRTIEPDNSCPSSSCFDIRFWRGGPATGQALLYDLLVYGVFAAHSPPTWTAFIFDWHIAGAGALIMTRQGTSNQLGTFPPPRSYYQPRSFL